MPDFLTAPFQNGPRVDPLDVLIRLLVALALGAAVAFIYRRTRKSLEFTASFPGTLVLLAVLIAMVTQVIGDNVARAFSLVGALSIVRFRTVVRDTQDTAYVIFAVVVGMAVGAKTPMVGVIGLAVIGGTAFLMMPRAHLVPPVEPVFLLTLRIALGVDVNQLLGGVLDSRVRERELLSMGTVRQGASVEVIYEMRLRSEVSADDLLNSLHRIEGVQSVQLRRRGFEEE